MTIGSIQVDETVRSSGGPDVAAPGRPSLRRNISWTLVGNVVYAACQWGVLIAIARLGTAEMVGQFAFAVALASPVFIFANLNLRSVQVTDASDRFQPQDYVSLRCLTATGAVVIVITVAMLFHDPYAMGLVLAAIACVKSTESLSDVIHGIQHKRERMKAISIARVIRGVLSLGTLAAVLAVTKSLPAALIGLALVNTLVVLAVDIPAATRIPGEPAESRPFALHLRPQTLLPLALLALPVGLSFAILSFNLNLPRYFIAHYLDTTSLGYYAAAAYLLVATDMVVRSARQTALPRLARLAAQDRITDFCWVTSKLMLLGAGCSLPFLSLAWFGGETILARVYGSEYREAADVFFWLMVANIIWQSSVPTAVLLAMQYYWTDLGIRIATTLVIALAALTLVPEYGLVGAAWSMVAGRISASIGTAAFMAITVGRIWQQSSPTAAQTY